MNLKQLIEYLEQKDRDMIVPIGFGAPHSYKGDYTCVAFEPERDVTIGMMLQCVRDALGRTYKGWYSGLCWMGHNTEVYLAIEGYTGEKIGTILLDYMTGVYDSEECEHLRGVIGRSTDEIAGLIAKIDEKNRLIVNDRDTLRSIERICVELEMCNPKAVSRDVKAIKSMKRISNIMEEWDPNIGREEESKSWWKNGYAIISVAIDRDEVIKQQNQTLLHIKAELEAAKQYNPFNLVLMAGSMENIANIVNGQTKPFIDEGCVGCCKVVDVAARLQEELESTRNMYRSSSDECCGQRKTIGDLRTKIWELERTLPENFWDVVAKKDATIRQQKNTIGELNDENLSLRVTINDMAKKHIWYKNTIDELKDRNAEDLYELYAIDKAEFSSMKSNYEIILQNRRNRGDKLEDNVNGLEAELSARKEDSEVLKKVVDAIRELQNLTGMVTTYDMRHIRDMVKDYLDAPEGSDEKEQ